MKLGVAGLALLGLRNDNSPEYMEKQANIAKERPDQGGLEGKYRKHQEIRHEILNSIGCATKESIYSDTL